jgi:hypothetical protein
VCFEKSEHLLHTLSFFEMPTIYNTFASYTQLVPIPNWLGIMDKKGVKKNGSSSPPEALPYT